MPAESFVKFKITWDYKGERGTYRLWDDKFRNQMADWTRIWRRLVSEVLIPYLVRQFGSEGREGERKWAELAPTTLRRRLYLGKPILQQTGMLQMSFIGGPDHIEEIEAKRMKWGSASRYALFHQSGTGIKLGDPTPRSYERVERLKARKGEPLIGWTEHWEPTEKGRGMPQRPILDLYWGETKESRRTSWHNRMMDIIRRELREAARRAGFRTHMVGETIGWGPEGPPPPGVEALQIGNIAMGNI